MATTKAGIAGVVVLIGVTASIVTYYHARTMLQVQDQSLRRQEDQATQLAAENARLADLLVAAERAAVNNPASELSNLRAETDALRRQTNELAVLRQQNRELTRPTRSRPATALQEKEDTIARIQFEKVWMLTFSLYARKHGHFPESFDQASTFWPKDFKPETSVSSDQFEIVYSGPLIGGESVSQVIAIREKEPRVHENGKSFKSYGMADGSVQTISMPLTWTEVNGEKITFDTFEAWEKKHILQPAGP